MVDRTDIVNEEVPKDTVNTLIYNYASSNFKPCSWNQLGEKFFKNEKNVSSPNFVIITYLFDNYKSLSPIIHLSLHFKNLYHYCFQFWMPFYYVTNSKFIYWIMTFYLHTVPAKVVDLFIWLIGKEPRQVCQVSSYLYNFCIL